MKQKTRNGKFTIEIEEEYLKETIGIPVTIGNGTAVIKLFAEEASVTLEEIADAIISGSSWGHGCDRVVNSNLFQMLDIYLEIKKSKDICVTYNFKIPNYQSTNDVFIAISRNIRI